MLQSNFILRLITILYLASPQQSLCQTTPPEASVPNKPISFTFNLTTSAKTSAGIFKTDGTLLKTLWSGVNYKIGSYEEFWDCKDDDGNLVPKGNYIVKVLSNNVAYSWQKPIGNTSLNATGNTVHHSGDAITSMVAVGKNIYFAAGYNEGRNAHQRFEIGKPNLVSTTLKGQGATMRFLTTDGNIIYCAAQEGTQYFITGINARPGGTDSLAYFSKGTIVNSHAFAYSSFDIININNYLDPQNISGLAVQITGRYLFASHRSENLLKVFDKITGALVQTINVTNPRELVCDGDNNLWMISGTNTVAKYNVTSSGTVSPAIIVLSQLEAPLALNVSRDNVKVAIIDGGNSQQVKFYDNKTGVLLSTIGQNGGYRFNPTVYDDKFYFANTRLFTENDWGRAHAYIAFEPDGSYWVGDYGNMRSQHFTSGGTYIDNIQYIGFSYSSQADMNDPTRIFSDFLEFNFNYSNNTWKFIRNWSYNITIPTMYDEDRMRSVATLTNGITYALYNDTIGRELVELNPQTGLRHTHIHMDNINSELYPDGSQWQIGRNNVGTSTFWKRKSITSFDSSNNIIWGDYVTIETSPPVELDDPLTPDGYLRRSQYTSTGIVATYAQNGYYEAGALGRGKGWHLGGIKGGKWLFKTSPSTSLQYEGPFPKDAFEIGNGTINAGTFMQVVDRNIFFGQKCEGWKGNQVNEYKHYYDNGLLIGNFGADATEVAKSGIEAYPGMAGNANSGTYVKVGNDIYFYHSDEGYHAGVHQWKITGLNTIQEQDIAITVSSLANGLNACFYSTDDLNNLNTISRSAQKNLTFSGLSARWQGYVKTASSENYIFYVKTNSSCRVWMGEKLIIDNWTNNSNTELTSNLISLKSEVYNALRIESRAPIVLSWSSTSVNKQVIPSENMYRDSLTDTDYSYNLLEGLPYANSIENGLYGYTRSPENDVLKNKYDGTGWWSLRTNAQTYYKDSIDVQAELYPGNGLTSGVISRDLGNLNKPLQQWIIAGQFTYPTQDSEDNNSDKSYFEILDINNKVILRVERRQVAYPNDYRMYANNQLVFQGSISDFINLGEVPQPVEIIVSKTGLSFKYGDHLLSNVPVVDASSIMQQPKTMRIYFSSTKKGHVMSIAGMRFNLPVNFRSKASGQWKNISTWQSSVDSINWKDAIKFPTSNDNNITIQNGHSIVLADSLTIDQLTINNGGILKISTKGILIINNGPGEDIAIEPSGILIVQSDSSGTGRIGNSSGTVSGNITVERYIDSLVTKSYRLLSPSVNTANGPKPFIRDNWQEGQNNADLKSNSNLTPRHGIHITGSVTGANGFDATNKGTASLFTYNPTNLTPSWVGASNTNATRLEAKKGYLVLINGDRSTDLRSNNSPSSTTLRATGSLVSGTQIFTKPEGDRGTFLIGNPYPSPVDWSLIYNDSSTANAKNFENFFTYWDPHIATSGGYVTVNSSGIKSADTKATTEIQSGEAILLKPKKGVTAALLTIKESHKSTTNNLNIFRLAPQQQFMTSLYFKNDKGIRVMADGVNTVFDNMFSTEVDGYDAEEISNWRENIAILRDDKMLSIEQRPDIVIKDTLPLAIQRLFLRDYEWQFNPAGFYPSTLRAYLQDNFLNTLTTISMTTITVIPFSVNTDTSSSGRDRFTIIFDRSEELPQKQCLMKAYKKDTLIEVDWTVHNGLDIVGYEIEKSVDGNIFTKVGSVPAKFYESGSTYKWLDAEPRKGNNYYRIKIIDKAGAANNSQAEHVYIATGRSSIDVFPNPLVNDFTTVQFNNVAKGKYSLTLISISGQTIFQRTINHPGGSFSNVIPVDTHLPDGSYILQISGNGINYKKHLLKKSDRN